MPFYQYLALETDIRVMIYNGDSDPSINSFAAQNWTVALGLKEEQAWSPWTIDNCQRMGGYTTRYQGDLSYVTIRGAGHMVPEYKPEAAYTLMGSFIQGTSLPPYVVDCT